jgi:uncharacterized membrane protein YbhN (UPF0104 family)
MGPDIAADAGALDAAVRAQYATPLRLLCAAGFRLLGWLLCALELWFAGQLLGVELGLQQALILESLGQAARSAGFLLPGGLGVQEGSMLAVAGAIGVTPEAVLAIAVLRRGRELLYGLAGLALGATLAQRRVALATED